MLAFLLVSIFFNTSAKDCATAERYTTVQAVIWAPGTGWDTWHTAMLDAVVLVAAGADNVQDPFNPVGRSDPLETAALLVMAGHQTPDDAYRMVSNDVREGIGMPRLSIEVGSPADLGSSMLLRPGRR